MGIFYNSVLKMRENGRSLKNEVTIKPTKIIAKKPIVESNKTTETVVNKNDKGTSRKS